MRKSIPITAIVSGLFGITLALASGTGTPWSYEGDEGPRHWGKLDAKFESCTTGDNQSPIDIRDAKPASLKPISLTYKPLPLNVVNTGHTIQVNAPNGNMLLSQGKEYELQEFHFHTPSEHTIGGATKSMEIHFVHKARDGRIAFLAVFIDEGKTGVDGVDVLWKFSPKKVGEKKVTEIYFDAMSLIPKKGGYYKYSGSITTPPCTEGIDWHILKTPIELTSAQIRQFRSLFAMNARPVQAIKGRVVEQL